jgi:hypothetical protein
MTDKVDGGRAVNAASQSEAAAAGTGEAATPVSKQDKDGIAEKQAMVEKLFRHTNTFLAENRDDPLLVVESLAAIVVRYAALLGPVEQLADRLTVLQALIGQECEQIASLAHAAQWEKKAGDA